MSKQTPLPTSVTRGWPASPHAMSISRGAPAAARPTAWISGKFCVNRSSPTMALIVGVVARGELARGLFELRRPQVVRRRVDEIARQRHAFDDALQLVAVEALRQIEIDLARFGLAVTREAVEAERERERRKPRIVRLVGEAIDAVGQKLRQAAGKERILGFAGAFKPEQHAAEAAFSRQQQMPAGLRLETGGVGEGASLGAEQLAHVRVVCAVTNQIGIASAVPRATKIKIHDEFIELPATASPSTTSSRAVQVSLTSTA